MHMFISASAPAHPVPPIWWAGIAAAVGVIAVVVLSARTGARGAAARLARLVISLAVAGVASAVVVVAINHWHHAQLAANGQATLHKLVIVWLGMTGLLGIAVFLVVSWIASRRRPVVFIEPRRQRGRQSRASADAGWPPDPGPGYGTYYPVPGPEEPARGSRRRWGR
jgi:hypothetical protein